VENASLISLENDGFITWEFSHWKHSESCLVAAMVVPSLFN